MNIRIELKDAYDDGYKAGLQKAKEIAKKHKCDWDTGCLDENSEGDLRSSGYCHEAIATAIDKEMV